MTGQWQTLPYTMPINPIHVHLLPTGNVLVISGTGNNPANSLMQAALWNPQTGSITVQNLEYDMFCNAMVGLPDGRVLIAGGTLAYNPAFLGYPRLSIYDPATNLFTDEPSMAHGRWYPTATMLGNGSVMIYSGYSDTGPTNNTLEIFSESAGLGSALTTPWTPPLYPRMHLLPNGNIFYSGSTPQSNIYNPSTNAWTLGVATTNFGGSRLYGSSVLLPLTPANNYDPKVMIFGGGNPATATSEIIDLGASKPAWVFGPSMSSPRIEMDATMLPNGKVLLTGGSTNDEDPTTAHLNADMYDPVANTMSSAGTEAFARLYHTATLLMPDATVWVAGSNPAQGTYQPEMEIYSPPYLFNPDGTPATRPTITSVSASTLGYGSSFTVQTPDALTSNISSVVLMRNGSSTHAFDMDQRYVGLSFTTDTVNGVLNLTSPPNSNIAPPGYYMLFILNNSGVPSLASMVQISTAPTDVPPTGTITSPASNVTVNAGGSVSFAGTGTSTGSTISSYLWSFFDGIPSSSNLQNPGAVTYSIPGSHVATLTVTDAQGITDPHPPSVTITVPDFTLDASPTLNSVMQGANAPYAVTVTGGTGFVGNVSLSVSGLPTGATALFSPTTITNSGSSTMTVSTGTVPTGSYALTITATTGPLTHSEIVSLVIEPSNSNTGINFGSGFSASGLQLEGNAQLVGTALQLTDKTAQNEKGNGWWTTPVNVQTFTTDFTFQLTNAVADGFTFILQNAGPAAAGNGGSSLGFGGLAKSVAVKFDLFSNAGEGNNSTGLYTNGVGATVPAINLGGGNCTTAAPCPSPTTFAPGIPNLHSGDVFEVHITYDGTTLTMTITDVETSATFTTSWPINIPATVGANTAYAGFGGGTGGSTAVQQILAWTYNTTVLQPTATPFITPATGTYSSAQSVTITDSTANANIFYTLDGSTPGTAVGGSTMQFNASTPISVTASETINAIAIAPGLSASGVATSAITIQTAGSTPINFGSGFSGAGMQFNGSAVLNGTTLQITSTTPTSQTGSAYWATPVNVQSFTTDFMFQMTTPNSDGFTFVLQNIGATGIGSGGGGLGYAGLGKSVAVKFDLFSNNGEGNNSTGLYTGGNSPNVPATNLGGGTCTAAAPCPSPTTFAAGIPNLHSGDIFQVHMVYDGTNLTMTITDTVVPTNTYTVAFPINIPTTVKANTAYAGFTGSTGSTTALQQILTWTYSNGTPLTATPTFLPVAGTYGGTQSVTISDTTAGSSIFYTLDGTTPGTVVGGSTLQFNAATPISVTASETINAIATAPGLATSVPTSASYVINTPAATPMITPAGGTYMVTQSVTISDSSPGSSIFYALDGSTPGTAVGGSTMQFNAATPISVTASETINAIATAPGFATSTLATANYVISSVPPAATPTFLPIAGTYGGTQSVTISDSTAGSSIFYTLDGSTPGTAVGGSTMQFNAATPISVTASETIKAIATAPGFSTSALTSASYVINGPAATPMITPPTGTYTTSQSVTISDSTAGSSIFYTLDGSTPGTAVGGSTLQFNAATPILVTATETINAIATAPGFTTSAVAAAVITIQTGGTTPINFGSGFSGAGMQFNGSAVLNGTALQLTSTTPASQTASAFWATPVNVQSFTTDFMFQLTNPKGDGFTFVLQNTGVTAIGSGGGGLGFAGLGKSVAVKFDLFNNSGEGNNSTGLFTGGKSPNVPATNLGGGTCTTAAPCPSPTTFAAGIPNLHSGDIFQVHMAYDGTNLTMTITDTAVPTNTFTVAFPINIPTTVKGNTAYAGFTAGTGSNTALQQILTWTYSNSTPSTATPTFLPVAGTYMVTQSVTISDSTAGSSIFYTLDGSTPGTAVGGSTLQFNAATPISVTASETINAIATAPGFATSTLATANYVISSVPPAATPTFLPIAGTYGGTQSVTISDSTAGSSIFYTLDGSTPGTAVGGSTLQFNAAIPISVSASETINAIATAPGFATSAPTSASYVINGPAATPMITPATGTYTTSQSVTISDSTAGSSIFYTLDGSTPGTAVGGSTLQFNVATPILVTATETINAIATAPGFTTSAVAAAVITIQTGGTTPINFGSGFSGAGMQFNGSAVLNGTALQLTSTTPASQTASAFWATPVNVQSFTTDFMFQLTNPKGDGFTFVLQNTGVTAIGSGGGGLGFAGLGKSVAVKFDLFNNSGEGNNSTGLFTGGKSPNVPATNLGGGTCTTAAPCPSPTTFAAGIPNLHSGDIFQVHMVYDGTNLTMTITDTAVPTNTFTTAFPINIPTTVKGNTAYAGFTAGTGSNTALQQILTWTYAN